MNDLNNIQQIEKILKIKLKDLNTLKSDINPENWHSPRYTLNANRQLTKLELFSCGIKNINLELIISNLKELEEFKRIKLME